MCLYPRFILNRKYKPNKKNNFNPPPCNDERIKYVPIGCGQCIECRTQKAREWQIRLAEELKATKHAYFVTLSFSPQSIQELSEKYKIEDVNELATKSTRLFLERWRKIHKKSIKHWFVTELGQTNTERIHLHGIVFPEQVKDMQKFTELWKYGNTWIGDYCSERTVNYIVKYMLKIDEMHPTYKSIILASAGLGKGYINNNTRRMHKYTPFETTEYYTTTNGVKLNLPIYYRNKLFTEEEREKLWLDRLEQHTIFVRGVKFDTSTYEGLMKYEKFLREEQKTNKAIGYGDSTWKAKDYKITLEMLNSNHVHT